MTLLNLSFIAQTNWLLAAAAAAADVAEYKNKTITWNTNKYRCGLSTLRVPCEIY